MISSKYTISSVEFKNGQDFGFATLSPSALKVDIAVLLNGFTMNDYGKLRAKISPTSRSIKEINAMAADVEKHLTRSLLGDVAFKAPLWQETLEFGTKSANTVLTDSNLQVNLTVGVWVRKEGDGYKAGLFFTHE